MSAAIGWPCRGGPLDGKMLAHAGDTYRVGKMPPPCTAAYSPSAAMPPNALAFTQGEYRLEPVGPKRMEWVFQGWQE